RGRTSRALVLNAGGANQRIVQSHGKVCHDFAMEPEPNPDLVAELARILRNEASAPVSAEWSQAATSHAGRIYAGGARYPLPHEAAEVFRELHEQMRDEVRG